MSNKSKVSDWETYRRLIGYVLPYWYIFIFSILGFMLFSAAQIAMADLMQFIVDSIAGKVSKQSGIITSIIFAGQEGRIEPNQSRNWIAVVIVVIGIVRGIGFFVGNYYMSYVARYLVHNLRVGLFDHMLRVPSNLYDSQSSGYLVSKIIFNVEQVTGAATNALKVAIREGLFAGGLVIYLLYKNWQLTLFFMVAFPVISVIVVWVGRRFRKISQRIQDSMGEVTKVSNETINAYREVRIFGGTEIEAQRFEQASSRNLAQGMKMAFYNALSPTVIQQPVVMVLAALIWVGLGLSNEMTPGAFIAYLTAAMLLPKPIRQLSEINSTIQKGLAAAEDIFQFIDTDVEIDRGSYCTDKLEGRVEFREVSFAYGPDSPAVLKNINFTIEPGQTVALVGLSGSGKSTLVSLLTRFYNHDQGQILLDGVDVNDYALSNLRSHIALVTQSVTLFDDSIYNNIAYGAMREASRDDVMAAVKAAHALEFIDNLPQGLDTLIGEDGVMLSGGQRQRIAIARALLKDAPILILDEATSALDNKAEFHIQQALETAMEGRTTIVIAHRLSTIEKADKIIVMQNGAVVEQGSHQQLLANKGLYTDLYHKQFSD